VGFVSARTKIDLTMDTDSQLILEMQDFAADQINPVLKRISAELLRMGRKRKKR
jgi:hypothetical protein